ncbi:CBS domain-containing protein [Streptomyces sp. MST-110588]|uniref:CBS domain-containing protein n=1 Tax=Streptomyces sp. MST-110588 TaxID=2833628 RepID=UPI001F5C867D|nr:CBS domain-containing protein [Streptomyces sp. MST-110588]UNO38893.1 CBS domain-containing protein [Streptomyces sp. MST-110588]
MDHRLIGRLMNTDVVKARYGTSFKEVVSILAKHRKTGLPVVDGDGKVLGVISETDLMFRQAAQDILQNRWYNRRRLTGSARAARARARSLRAGQLMTSPPVTVGPHQSVAEAARLMVAGRIDRLPVVDAEGRLCGLVTRSDLLKVYLRPDEEIREELITEVLVRTLGLKPAAIGVTVNAGVVTLRGRLPRSGEVRTAVRLAGRIDGVVAVVDELEYAEDDTADQVSEQLVRERAQEWLRRLTCRDEG